MAAGSSEGGSGETDGLVSAYFLLVLFRAVIEELECA